MKSMYLVLSVKQLKEALAVAEADRKSYSKDHNDLHCVVLEGLESATDSGGDEQLSSVSFNSAVERLHEKVLRRKKIFSK